MNLTPETIGSVPLSGIPIGVQPDMLPDPYNKHTIEMQVEQMSKNTKTNPLPFGHFTGPFPVQVNQPQFLTVNEILFEG